jgi:hypothetical protein
MDPVQQDSLANSETKWPTCSMLMWGTFGTKTPAERRYVFRSCAAAGAVLALFLIAKVMHFQPRPIVLRVVLIAVGLLMTYIALEFRRYLYQLDELARRMQMEAMACTYITGFVMAAWMGILWPFSSFLVHWQYKPTVLFMIPFLYFLLEPVRAGWLYYLSRRY